MYYAYIENEKINGIGQLRCLTDGIQNIEITEEVYNQMQVDTDLYIYDNGEIVLNPDYEEIKANERKQTFLQDFFKVEGFGYYRIHPKGYQSAVESMSVLFNAAIAMNGIQAGLIIFYQEPDFTKPEQCTEEWLVQHQIVMPAMTKEEFIQLWAVFTQAWNTRKHEIIGGINE